MTEDRDLLVHLAGYASITAVLATADWAGLMAPTLALPIVLGALYYGSSMLIRQLTNRARRDLQESAPRERATATDGGQRHRESSGDPSLEDRQTTTAGARNRSHET